MTNIVLLQIISVLVTNWIDTGTSTATLLWPPEANTVTHYECANVYSNRLAVVVIEGKTNQVQLSTELVCYLTRSYTWSKPQKVYNSWQTAMNIVTNVFTNSFSTNAGKWKE